MSLENDDYYLFDSESLAFKNPINILSTKKADMITNEFIKPVEEKPSQEKVTEPVLHEQVANSVILLMKDDAPIDEKLFKFDFNYKFPRWIFLVIFFYFLSLLLYLVTGLIYLLN